MALTVVKPSGIDSTGNYTVNGMTVSANANIANLAANGTVNFTSTSNVSLGAVANIKITGGTANYVLQTDGSGNLSWVAQSGGGGTPGGTNTQIQFNDGGTFGGNANLTFDKATSVLTINGNLSALNANLGNLAVANFFSGSGNLLSNIQAANITGTVANATHSVTANTVTTAAQPNITSVGLLSALSVGPNSGITLTGTSGYIRANSIQGTDGVAALYPAYSGVTGAVGITGNLTVGIGIAANITANGNVTANYFIGNGSSLSSITGANVTGTVSSATTASTVTTDAQPNITSVGTLTGLTSNGTINFTNASNVSLGAVGNIKITGGTANYVLQTDGAGNLSWVAQSGGGATASISNGTSNVNIAAANGNITMGVGGTANVVTVANTGFVVFGNINSNGNITVSRLISNVATGTAPFVVTSTTQVANLNAATAGTVTSGSQPNIASVGTLSSLTVSGNITGNSAIFAKSIVANAISSNSYIAAPTPYLNNGSGELKSLSTTTVGTTPSEVKIHPSGRFLYVANFSSNTVSMYSIGAGGVLTSIGTAVATGTSPTSIAIDPTGRFLYVTNAGSNTVSQFSINISTGALTSITTAIATQTQPWTITCDPTGRFAYVVTYAGGVSPTYVNMYSINSSTGALTSITSAISVTASGTWPGVTVEPTGRFVYILVAQTVYTYTISQTTGGLTFSTSLALTGIAGAGLGIVAHPAGNLLYINAESDALILVLSINTYTGDLTQQYSISTGSPTGTGVTNQFSTIAVGLGGSVLYTLNRDNTYSVFTISTITGYLTKTLTNVSTSTLYPAGVSVSSDGKYVAIVTQASNTLTMYATESFNAFNISAYGNITAGNIIANTQLVSSVATGTAPFLVTSTTQVANLNAATAGTVRTAAQPNITSTGNLTGLTVSNATGVVNFTNTANVTLGAVANLHISGGTSGYVLSTDGAGTLSWVAQSGGGGGGASIANGTSNVNIATANGNVTISSAGTANVVVVSSTSANVTGELNVSGNVTSNGIRLGYLGAPLSGSDKTTSYTLATPTDLGKIVTVGTGGSITIPNSTFSAGDTIGLYNNTSATVTVTCSTTNAYIAGTDTNKTSVTLATRGLATIVFISSTLCVISGSVS